MSTNFPGSLDDSTTLPDPGSGSYTNNPSHLGLHGNENAAIKALEAKVGTGASTPPGGGYIFTSSSNGTSSWQPAPAAGVWGLITGTLSNQTDLQTALNTKVQIGGDISGTIGTPLVLTSNGVTIVTLSGAQTLTNKILTAATATADPVVALGVATKQYVDALGSTSLVRNETPGGLINSSNTAYTTASTFATGSLKVYLNGQRLAPGSGIDFVEVTQGFTMQYAPTTGDVLLVDYETTNTTRFVQGSNSIIVQETPTGTVNGVTTAFTVLQAKYVANTLEVFLNGIQQTKTTDYAETTPGSGIFTFTSAPLTGDIVRVSYQFATGASGNADTVDGIHAGASPVANQLLALDSNARFDQSALPLGSVVQMASVTFTAAATGSTLIPLDDTIPQNTEGDQYMTLSITPKSTTNNLVIQVITFLSSNAANHLMTALFQDTTANALAVADQFMATSGGFASIPLTHVMAAGTTSSTTFKIRAGGNNANTTTFNGSATRFFGAINKSSIIIWEIKA